MAPYRNVRIRARDVASGAARGAPRIRADLADEGHLVATMRVARPMRVAGLSGETRCAGVMTTTTSGERSPPDLVECDFTATAPDRLWCADATYVATWTGWLYLAVAIDVLSRRVVGNGLPERPPAIVLIDTRGPGEPIGVRPV